MRNIVKTIQHTTHALGGVYKILTTSILIGVTCKYVYDGIKNHLTKKSGEHK